MAKSVTLTIRLDPEIRDRMDAARDRMPYKPTITAIVERGVELALAEMEGISDFSDQYIRSVAKEPHR